MMTVVVGVLAVAVVAWFALPGGSDLIEQPLRDEGDDLVMTAESWWLDHSRLVGVGVLLAIAGVASTWIHEDAALVIAGLALSATIAGTVVAWRHSGPSVVRLTRTQLVLRGRTLDLTQIRDFQVHWRSHGKEINNEEFVKRDLELELVTGRRLLVRLPHRTGGGDHFASVLRARMGERPAGSPPASDVAGTPLPVARVIESRRDRPR